MTEHVEAAKKILKDTRWSKTHTGVISCPADYSFYIQPYERAIDQAIELLDRSESPEEDIGSSPEVPRFLIEFHRGVHFITPELGTCEVVKASDHDAIVAAQSRRDREIWEMIDKTQSCTSGMSHADCLEWVKKKLGEAGSISKSVTPLEEE